MDAKKLKKLKFGERVGVAATIACFVVTAAFIALFSVALATKNDTLKILSVTLLPALLLISVAVSAVCNLKFTAKKEEIIGSYVRDVLIQNAAALHPERDSLTFYILVSSDRAELKANGYKEKVIFDLSPLGKLTAAGKSGVATILSRTLANTFCRLYERGASYKSVEYVLMSENKQRKPVPVIVGGAPDKKSYKEYLKGKN